MRRQEIIQIIDGTHPTAGRGIAIAHQALIMAAALAIAFETVPNLPAPLPSLLWWFELFILVFFAAEYFLRVICSDHPLRYVFSFWGVVDLLSWLPILFILNPEWAAVRTVRLMRLARVMKLIHTNRALIRLQRALRDSRGELGVFIILAGIMLYVAGVGIYIFEHEAQPEAFSSIPTSLWWAVVSFTTVGYGDIYPITAGGRIFTAAILFVGLGVIAVPTAIITSALINSDLVDRSEPDVESSGPETSDPGETGTSQNEPTRSK